MTRAPLLLLLVLLLPVASAADITIPGFSFSPARFETTPGATVTVQNLDASPHGVKHALFTSGVLDQDQTGTFTAPTTPGEYPYVCNVHGSSMKGTLVVREAGAATPAPATPTPASPTAATGAPSTPTPTPASTSATGGDASTPGPGLALLVLAAGVALATARRRRA